jgi:hypothetical protein
VNAYERLRRATTYVRWEEEDYHAYAPSLHARQAPRRKAGGQVELVPAEPLQSESVSLGGNRPVAEAGLPGTSPFTNE